MKKYYEHIMSKEPHQRRQHAMQIAGLVTAAVFVVWITTLGLRLGSSGDANVAQDGSNQTLNTAAAADSYAGQPNQLIVAPTSGY